MRWQHAVPCWVLLNVKINAAGLKDRTVADSLISQANQIVSDAEKIEREILEIVENKIK